MGNADEGSKQIEGVEIGADVAGLDGAVDEGIDCSLDQTARAFIEPRGTANKAVEGGGDDLLGGDVIDEEQHPGAEGFDRGHGFRKCARRCGHFFDLGAIDPFDESVAGGEVAIEGAGSYAGLFGDVIETGAGAETGKRIFCLVEDAFAVAFGVGAGLAPGGLWIGFCHS